MWRKAVTQQMAELPVPQAALPTVEQPVTRVDLPTVEVPAQRAPQPAHRPAEPQDLAQLLLPRPRRTRSLHSLLSFWAPTSQGSTTRAASFFQHVSATTWLRAS